MKGECYSYQTAEFGHWIIEIGVLKIQGMSHSPCNGNHFSSSYTMDIEVLSFDNPDVAKVINILYHSYNTECELVSWK